VDKNKNITKPPSGAKEMINIGKILSSHGVQGFAKIFLLTDFPERFEELEKVYIQKDKELIETKIDKIRYNHDTLLIKFSFFTSPEQVNLYKGSFIQIPESERFDLPDEFFYIDKLIGCKVYSSDNEYIGDITDVFDGANTVLEIKNDKKQEFLVPFVKEIVPSVDINNKKIIVNKLPGLFDQDFED
jgi:16S rRNA processing protein RimM